MSDYSESQPVIPDEPRESEEKSQLIDKVSINIKFSQDIIGLEIANNSESATIFLNIYGSPAFISKGVPIYSKNYYAADRKILQNIGISLISDKISTDVRVIGHYNLESENV